MLRKKLNNSSGINHQKETKNSIILRSLALGLFSFLIVFVAVGLIAPIQNTSATTNTCTTDASDNINCTKNQNLSVEVHNNPLYYYISVRSAHGAAGTPIAMAFGSEEGRTAFGNIASASDSVYVETNSPLTHQLMLSTTGTHTIGGISSALVANNLVSLNTIVNNDTLVTNTYFAPGGGNSITTATTLGQNTWGFALASNTEGIPENNFDADYSNPTLSSKWAQVPNVGNEVLVRQDTEPTSTTSVYYGVYAEKNISGGEYSNVMLYTALAEQPTQIRVNPNTATSGTTITVYTSINTTNITGEAATVKFYQLENDTPVEKGTCTNPTVALDTNNYLYVTCTVPSLTLDAVYGVQLSLTNLATTLSEDNVFTYATPSQQNQNTPQNNTPQNAPQQQLAQANTQSVGNGNANVSYVPTQQAGDSTSSSDSNDNASSTYNSPLGANNSNSKNNAATVASVQDDSQDVNIPVVVAVVAATIAASGGIAFAIVKHRDDDEEEEY